MIHRFFVTGTDTEIGKTLCACALMKAFETKGFSTVGMKPVAAGIAADGSNDDVRQLKAAATVAAPDEWVAPYVFKQAIAPHLAAALENIEIDQPKIILAEKSLQSLADVVVIEGAGGFRIPLGQTHNQFWDSADLVVSLDCPVILVVGLRLGCINHALLTVEAIASRGLKLAGWIANVVDAEMSAFEENLHTLKSLINRPLLGVIPRLSDGENAKAASQNLDITALLT
jgi:dethiobiotin synthetase